MQFRRMAIRSSNKCLMDRSPELCSKVQYRVTTECSHDYLAKYYWPKCLLGAIQSRTEYEDALAAIFEAILYELSLPSHLRHVFVLPTVVSAERSGKRMTSILSVLCWCSVLDV